TISHKILKAGELEGVLGFDILFNQVMDKYFKPYHSEAIEIVAINELNEVVYRTTDISEEALEDFKAMARDKERRPFSEHVVIKKSIEAFNVDVLFIIDRQAYLGPDLSGQLYPGGRWVIVVGLLLIFIFAYMGASIATRPIRKLEHSVKVIVEGKESNDLYPGFKDLDEIVDLFEEFQETIHRNKKSIEKMSDELDERNQTLMILNLEYEKAYEELEHFSKELSQKENAYERLVENIVDLIWSIDKDGNITYCNEKMLELLGYEDHEFIGMPLNAFVPNFRMNYGENPYQLLYSRDYDAIDIEFIDKNNEKVILTSTSTTRIFRNGELDSIQGVSRDVTLEKKMYTELNVRNRDLMLINRIGKEMTMTDNLNSVLDLILENVDALFEIKVATIRFLDADGQLKVQAVTGDVDELLWAMESSEAMESHLGHAIKTHTPVVLNDLEDILLEEDERIVNVIASGYKLAILPLWNSVRSFGALSIISIDTIDHRIIEVLSAFANSTSVAMEKAMLFESLQSNYFKTIEMLMTAMEAKNHMMQGHSNRVSRLSEYIGKKLYLTEEETKDLYVAGLLHDVGKIGLRDALLRQDFRAELFDVHHEIKSLHVEIGKKILSPIGLKERIIEGVYYHHKHFDQSGYPEESLKEVPFFALIIGVADDIDIMMRRRINNPLSIEEMKRVLVEGSGTKYSPEIVNLMSELIDVHDEQLIEIIYGKAQVEL
ncbi:MAG: PAS domain S-box protein, partial [Clostridia bacterium]|nr:PAS domain S-box protein [Clostridia bacterium]